MKKSRKVTCVNTEMKEHRVSLPKSQQQLSQLSDDDENVFATSLIDRYSARPQQLKSMCLAKFAVNYEPSSPSPNQTHELDIDEEYNENDDNNEEDDYIEKIKLNNGLGRMKKRKREAILRTRKYRVHSEPEKYYHSKLLLYYPWYNEEEIISGFDTYQNSYISKKEKIDENSHHFNDDSEIFDLSEQDVENNLPQSTWDLTAPSIAQEDGLTLNEGFTTVQQLTEEKVPDTDIALDCNNTEKHHDVLLKLYSKAANREYMNFSEYCKHIRGLNNEQKHIVMFNRQWCKNYVHAVQQNQTIDGYRIFLSGPGGTGKSHVVKLIQRDMSYFVHNVVNADPDQPVVLMTAPTGSAAFQIGGSTIDSALLLYDGCKNKPSWEKKTIMQIRLEYLTLLLTDEISMVGFKKFQDMNRTICSIKGSHNGNWGNICVLVVGDLYQLPPVGQRPIYMSPQKINSLNDFAPNGWDDMQLHELTQTM